MLCLRYNAVISASLLKNSFTTNNFYSQVSSRSINTSPTIDVSAPKWKLLSAICLERVPIISPPMTKMEQEMHQMLEKFDRIKSLKSDHELRQDEDKKLAKNLADGNQDDNNPEAATRQTAQDFEDACNEELQRFKPAPRKTAEEGDLKSTNRKLDKHLLFIVKEESEDKKMWRLPQTQWKEGETLRQTAERALKEHVKIPDTSVRILGNAPWGVHTVKYSSFFRQKMGFTGAKIFFFKAQLLDKNCTTCSGTEHNWLGREELGDRLEPEYLRSVQKFLIDED